VAVSWVGEVESVRVVGGDTFHAAVSERAVSEQAGRPGETGQRVMLAVYPARRIDPPTRLVVRGREVRVLGTQMPPWPDEPALVNCVVATPALPDDAVITDAPSDVLDVATGRLGVEGAVRWSGAVHVSSPAPATVEAAGEDAPLNRAVITLPLDAVYAPDMVLRVTGSRAPALIGARFVLSGELLDSDGEVRRIVGYRPEGAA
jgi:hypothetical protein